MRDKIEHWRNGIKDGIPICLGYFAVSFTFGIVAKNAGFTLFQAVLISLTNFTSAGQFAALGLIVSSSSYMEMAVTQLIINLRYLLMSFSLSQKMNSETAFLHRFPIAFGVTDEIFGVSVCQKGKLNPFYHYGLISIGMTGWAFGTFCGVALGNYLPERIMSALSIALYGMFIAVIVPQAKGNRLLSVIILLSMAMSMMFAEIPFLSHISSGFRIIILTILIAGGAALLFPIKEVADER